MEEITMSKFRAWIINLLGGVPKKAFENKECELKNKEYELKKAKLDIKLWRDIATDATKRNDRINKNLHTITSKMTLTDYPSFTEDDIKTRGKEYVIRQLGNAVYPYAEHCIHDGVYYVGALIYQNKED